MKVKNWEMKLKIFEGLYTRVIQPIIDTNTHLGYHSLAKNKGKNYSNETEKSFMDGLLRNNRSNIMAHIEVSP